jgi:hypothetical protein
MSEEFIKLFRPYTPQDDGDITGSLITGVRSNADQVASDLRTTSKLGYSPGVISDNNRAELTEQKNLVELKDKVGESRVLQKLFRRNPTLPRIIHDDMDNSGKSQRMAQELSYGNRMAGSFEILQGLGWRFVEGVHELTDREEALEKKATARAEGVFKGAIPAMTIQEAYAEGTPEALWQFLKENSAQQIPLMAPGIAGSTIGTAVGAGIGSLFGGVGAIPGALIGNRVGSFIPSFIFGMGEVQQAIKEIDPTAERPDVAFTGGALIGALDSLLPFGIGRRLIKAFGFDAAHMVLKLTAKEMVKRAAIEGGKGMGLEGVTEGIQTAIEAVSASIATDTDVDVPRLVDDMVNAFSIGALMGGTVATVVSPVSEHIKARRLQKTMKGLDKFAKESKLRERNKVMFGEVTGKYIREGGIDQFVVNRDMLLWWVEQQGDPKLLDLLNVADQLDNEEVVLSPETFSAYVLGVEGYEQLIRFVRTVDGRSVESTERDFSQLEIVEALGVKLGDYPIPDELKAKVTKTLEEFKTKDAAEVFETMAPEVEPILNALYADVVKDSLDTTELQLEGRLRQLDAEIDVKNDLILATERELKTAEKANKATKQIEQRLDKLFRERDALIDQQRQIDVPGEIITSAEAFRRASAPEVDPAAVQKKKPIKLKEDALKKLEIQTTQKQIRATRKAFVAALKAAKSLSKMKKAVEKEIRKMPIADKQKLIQIGRITSVETVAQFNKVLPLVRVRLDDLMTKGHRRAIKAAIKAQAKGTKVKGKEGKFDPEVQEFLDEINHILGLKVKELKDRQDVQKRFDDHRNTIEPNPDEAYKATLYGLLLNDPTVDLAEAETFLINLVKLKEQGKLASMARRNTRKLKIERDVNAGREAVLAGKEPQMIDTSSLAGRIRLRIQSAGNIKDSMLMAWSDIIDIAFNKEGVDAEALIESLLISDEIGAWKEANVKWEGRFLDDYREIYELKNNNQAINRMIDDNKVHKLGTFQNKNGKQVKLQLSVSQIRKIWMERQDPSLQGIHESEVGNAYSEQMLAAMWAKLDGKDYDFALAQLAIYREFYNDINKVYKRMYGVNLPFNEFYSPIARDKSVAIEGVEGAFGGEESIINQYKLRRSIPKALLKRKKNELPLAAQHDLGAMYQHLHNMNWFIHTAEKVLHIKNVFKNEVLKEAIELQHGEGMMRNINGFIEDFSVGHIKKGDEFNKFISNINSRFAESVLALKPTIGIKQVTSWFAMADGIPSKDFLKYQLEFLKNPRKVVKFLYNSGASLQTRGNSLEFELARLGTVDKKVFNMKSQAKWRDIEFAMIKLGDRIPIYAGGWAVYQHAVQSGKTHKQAIKIFESAFNDTQQSTDIDKLSSLQRNTAIGRTLTMFQTARLALIRGEMRAWRQSPLPLIGRKKIGWFDFGKRIGYYHFVMPMFIQWIASGFKWEDDRQLVAAITGQFNSFIILGDYLTFTLLDIISDDKQFDVDTNLPLIAIVNEVLRGMSSIAEADGDFDSEEMLDAFYDLSSVFGKIIGKPIDQVMNFMGGVGDIEDREIEKGLKRVLGFSEKIAEDNPFD